jgi:hypothetical protein
VNVPNHPALHLRQQPEPASLNPPRSEHFR